MVLTTPALHNQKKERTSFTQEELRKLWVLHGQVYDFTDFVKYHPAGSKAILLGRGRDCTVLFESYHTILPSDALLEKYRVSAPNAKLETSRSAKLFSFADDGFYRTLKQRTREYFKENNLHTKATPIEIVYFVATILSIYYFTWAAFVQGSLIAAVLHGVGRALCIIRPTHAASHYAMFRSPWLNQWAYRISMALSGSSPAQWTTKHIINHHVETNLSPTDDDTMYPVKRILHELPRLAFHKYQHIYIWLVYPYTTILWHFSNLVKLALGASRGQMYEGIAEVKQESSGDWVETALSLFFFTFFRLLLPFVCLPFGTALTVFLLSEWTCSTWFSLQFAVSHEVDECVEHEKGLLDTLKANEAKPEKDQPATGLIDWGSHQVRSSHNYGADSLLSLHFSGGLNLQIEHHLFPSIHYVHYPALSKIVRQTCKEYNLPYILSPSMMGAVTKHYHQLKKMGAEN
jgi:fatty acid desaturase